jgi:iron complex outermembrane receptor protein
MRHKSRKHRKKRMGEAALHRIQAAVVAAADTVAGYDRKRFTWGFIVSLSALALGSYHPAMAQDKRLQDWKQGPYDPDQDELALRANAKSGRSAFDLAGRAARTPDYDRGAAPPIRLAANEDPPGGSKQPFDVPAGDLEGALFTFSGQANLQILYSSDLVTGLRTRGVQGDYTPDEALTRLLADTGLEYRYSNPTTITLHRSDSPGAAAAGAAGAAGAAAAASQAQPSKPVKVPEVVVKEVVERTPANDPPDGYKADYSSTVTRSQMSIDENPTSVGVVTRDLIKDSFARTQNDAFEAVSGVSRSNTRLGRSEGINIRGFEVCSFGGNFNGMKVNGLPTDCVFAPDWGIVERYEIVKGPTSIVGGAANPGGIVNRITKTPQRFNFTTVESNVGSYGLARGMVDANGVMPNHQDIRGRLVFAVEDGGNFIDFTPVRQYTVAPSAEFDLFKGAGKLLIVGTYQKFQGASYPGWPFTSDGKMLDVPRTRNFGGGAGVGAYTSYTGYNGEVHYNHQFIHDIKLSAKGKVSKSDLTDNVVYSYTPGGIPPTGDSYLNNGFRHTRFDTYAGELTLSKEFSLFGQKHEILAGADHRDMTQHFFLGYTYLPEGGPFVIDNVFNPRNGIRVASDSFLTSTATEPRRSTLKQTGVFAQAIVRPFERLTLVLAGRHDEADSTNRNTVTGQQNDQTRSAWTGRAGATVKVTEWMNVYGGVQQGFAPQPFVLTRGNQMLEPEKSINYETGAKLNFFDDRLRITTAVFRTYLRNADTIDPADPRFSIAVGEQRHQGVELDVNGQPTPGLNLNVAFTYLDAEITKDNSPGFIGSTPRLVPRDYFGRVFATYELQSGPLRGFGFGGGVYLTGGYELSLPNVVSTDPYQRVDAVLFYRGNKRYDVTVNLRNLLNAKYIESPGTINSYNSFGAPISAFASLRVFF